MTDWNFDMSQAPKGHYVTRTKQLGKKVVSYEVHVPEDIIATDGEIVTVSRWLPAVTTGPAHTRRPKGRWNMFGTNETPLAWMPWPTAPKKGESNGR
jgi:hypothetical protein